MTTRFWNGGTADWFTALQWSGGVAPGPGDVAVVNSGTVQIVGSDEAIDDATLGATIFVPINGVQITLGSVASLAPAMLAAADATFEQTVTIVSNATAPYAALDITGPIGLSGTVLASAAGGTFDIAAGAGTFDLLHDGFIDVSGGDNLVPDRWSPTAM
jgi:hypothetical protein